MSTPNEPKYYQHLESKMASSETLRRKRRSILSGETFLSDM